MHKIDSNGLLDPWSSGGVTPDKVPKDAPSSVQPVIIRSDFLCHISSRELVSHSGLIFRRGN